MQVHRLNSGSFVSLSKVIIAKMVMALLVSCLAFDTFIHAQDTQSSTSQPSELQRSDFVSNASFVVGSYQPPVGEQSIEAIAEAATKFLGTLDEKQRKQIVHDLRSDERRKWTNLPAPRDAGGLRLGDMNDKQLKAACDLMRTMFSEQGYSKMVNIMLADDQLLRNGKSRPGFGTENFSMVVFGSPDATEPWAFQLDGHHVGVNVAIGNDQTTISPSFIGTQPHSYKIASQSVQPLEKETNGAYELLNSLEREQKLKAIVGQRRGRIVTGPGNDDVVPETMGLSCKSFNDDQKKRLMALVGQWVNDLRPEDAERRMKQLEGEIDEMHFAWNGQTTAESDVSYRIQGPSLIIEYACQDLGGQPIDHLHTMYRDPTNDYGGQLK